MILKGYRNLSDGLWDIPIVAPPTHPGLYRNRSNHKSAPVVKHSKAKRILRQQQRACNEPTLQQIDECVKALDCQKANVIIRKKQTMVNLAKYLHATCLSPPVPTFTKAIKNNQFITWPGLTTKLINRHLPKSLYTYQGHLKSEKQGLQSTKTTNSSSPSEDYFPTSARPNKKSKEACYALYEACDIAGHMDLTGRFPKTSSSGNQCILVG